MSPWISSTLTNLWWSLFTILMANSHTLSDGSIQDLIILKIQIATLCSLISTPLCIFSAWFTIYNSTFGSGDFQAYLHGRGTVSSCYRMCPSLGMPLCITKDFKLLYSKSGTCMHTCSWPFLAFLRKSVSCRQTSLSAHTLFPSMPTCQHWTSHCLQIYS